MQEQNVGLTSYLKALNYNYKSILCQLQ